MKFNTYRGSIGSGDDGSLKIGDDGSRYSGEWGAKGLDFPASSIKSLGLGNNQIACMGDTRIQKDPSINKYLFVEPKHYIIP